MRMTRSSATFGSVSFLRRSSRTEIACRSAARVRSRYPGVKSEIRSSIPETPVLAASSGAKRACTSRSSCAFWSLRAIQSPPETGRGAGGGAACEQAKRSAAIASGVRMGRAVYAPEPAAQRARRVPPLLLLLPDRLACGRRLRRVFLAHQDHDVGGVLPELRRAADADAHADELRGSDDPRLLRELERVGLHAPELVDGGERFVERRFDLRDLLPRHPALVLRHLASVGLRDLLELRILRHGARAGVCAPPRDRLIQVRLDLLRV